MGWARSHVRWAEHVSFLTRAAISIDVLLADVSSPGHGGTCLFLGTVRNGPDEHGVTAIEYSAYEENLEAEFDRLLSGARGRWPARPLHALLRLAPSPGGEACIAIAAAAPHRAQAFEPCRY